MEDIWNTEKQQKRIRENQEYVDNWSKQLDQQIRQNAYNSYEVPQETIQKATSLSDEGRANLMRRLATYPTVQKENEYFTASTIKEKADNFLREHSRDCLLNCVTAL